MGGVPGARPPSPSGPCRYGSHGGPPPILEAGTVVRSVVIAIGWHGQERSNDPCAESDFTGASPVLVMIARARVSLRWHRLVRFPSRQPHPAGSAKTRRCRGRAAE